MSGDEASVAKDEAEIYQIGKRMGEQAWSFREGFKFGFTGDGTRPASPGRLLAIAYQRFLISEAEKDSNRPPDDRRDPLAEG